MKSYKKEEIIKLCKEASIDMKSFYNAKMVNYKGKAKDASLYYTEIIAEWLLENFYCFNDIKEISRKNKYKISAHIANIEKETNRQEEMLAKRIYQQKKVGELEFLDYQVPLKNKNTDKGVGKIDLLAVNHKEKCVYIFELKKEESPETMLRCVLEGYTYLKIVCPKKLFSDYGLVDKSYKLKAAPLVYMNGFQHREYKCSKRVCLHKLMKKLDCTPFYIIPKTMFVIQKEEC